jgi:hypothetical protein
MSHLFDTLKQELAEARRRLHDLCGHHRMVRQFLCVIINKQIYIPMGNIVIQMPQAGQPAVSTPIVAILDDAVSLKQIPGSVGVLVSVSSDNPLVAVPDSNGNILPLGPGTANFTEVNSWSYTDEGKGLPVVGKLESSTIGVTVTSGPEQVVQQLSGGTPVPAGTPTVGTFTAGQTS